MNKISHKAAFYGDIQIGDNVRIDDFCILTGNIKIGNNIHIAPYCFFSGGEGIVIQDYAQFAPRITLLTGSDDYSGLSLVGPTIPDAYKPGLDRGPIIIERHVLLGINTVVMPYVTIKEGACTGAFTFVKKDLKPWSMYVGCPARFLRKRDRYMINLEKHFERELYETKHHGQD